MPPPTQEPLGLLLARTAKAVSRAFDDALAEAGGSRPLWLILLTLRRRPWETQRELAHALDISGPTLTHHLETMESAGLIARERHPRDRRVQVVRLTTEGERTFARLRTVAVRHDERLRAGLDEDAEQQLRRHLGTLLGSVTGLADGQAPPR